MSFFSFTRRSLTTAKQAQVIDNFISVKSECGKFNLKTTLFPALEDKPKRRQTIWFFHAYGSYLKKYVPVMQLYQNEGYDVIGFDMRGKGESDGKRGLIDDPDAWCSDSLQFIRQAKHTTQDEIIVIGYSLGACYLFGTYNYLAKNDPEIHSQIKQMLVVSPQCGMGPYWYPRK
jgi:alpha-beta hydrolase superfamily lysophospholipase